MRPDVVMTNTLVPSGNVNHMTDDGSHGYHGKILVVTVSPVNMTHDSRDQEQDATASGPNPTPVAVYVKEPKNDSVTVDQYLQATSRSMMNNGVVRDDSFVIGPSSISSKGTALPLVFNDSPMDSNSHPINYHNGNNAIAGNDVNNDTEIVFDTGMYQTNKRCGLSVTFLIILCAGICAVPRRLQLSISHSAILNHL